MHLAPHHFQAQGRYFAEAQHFALSSLFPHGYGLAGIELDDEALLNGTVALVHARGIMPDGLPFHFPHDAVPDPLPLEELFSPTAQGHRVLLGIPAFRPDGANCAAEADGTRPDARYTSDARPVPDVLTGRDEKAVAFARKNLRLLLAPEKDDSGDEPAGDGAEEGNGAPGEGLVTLPLARVERDGSGRFRYDPDYVPPTLQVGASRSLGALVARLVEVLESRAAALAAERTGRGGGGSDELVSFWLAHAVNSNLPLLRHHLANGVAHPERLFTDLSMLAGALGTFSLTAEVARLPSYDHANPGPGFRELERKIRDHVGTVVPTNVAELPVEPRDEYFHTAAVADRRALEDSATWYLGVRCDAPRDEVIRNVPSRVKVCSAKHIDRLVREAYPGLEIEHAPTPPSGVTPRPGAEYFRLRPTEPCWRSIAETASAGIYVPGSLPDAKLELVAVLE